MVMENGQSSIDRALYQQSDTSKTVWRQKQKPKLPQNRWNYGCAWKIAAEQMTVHF